MPRQIVAPLSAAQFYNGVLAGDRAVLAKAITLTESTLAADRLKSERLLKKLMPYTGQSIRIGISGVPGVGKSTFIEVFGELLTHHGKKVGVLTVDPTSQKSGGSILGDKTRMERLSRNPHVFIRPSPSSLALGGVTYHTREAILLCEAAGFDIILVETIGVGQSETQVRSMVDFFLLLMLAGAGDELQGIKKGIMEMVDGIAINKAEGNNIQASQMAKADALNALHLQPGHVSGWTPQVLTMSARNNYGIDKVWDMIREFHQHALATGYFEDNRLQQMKQWLEEDVDAYFRNLMSKPNVLLQKKQLLKRVIDRLILPSEAARLLWKRLGLKG
jgi:LAO/AO transport system kinase